MGFLYFFKICLNEKFMMKKNREKWEKFSWHFGVNCVVECNWIIIMKTKIDIVYSLRVSNLNQVVKLDIECILYHKFNEFDVIQDPKYI